MKDATLQKLIQFAFDAPGPKTWWITRLAMYNALQDKFAPHDGGMTSCLGISTGDKFARDILGLKKTRLTIANYPEHSFLDLRFEDGQFDFCVSDQVLEHVEGSPFKAVSESARVIKRGGRVCHTTCFINGVHGAPSDYWRYTLEALKLLAHDAGLEVEMIGGWGNREAQTIIDSNLRFKPIPNDPSNPIYQMAIRNEPDWPITTWIVARKP